MSHPQDHPIVSRFDPWHAYERVRAWAEDTWCGSHRRYRGPAGLTGAIIGLLDEHPQYDVYNDAFITVEAVRAYYDPDRFWWESSYIERMHDQAQQAIDHELRMAPKELRSPSLRLPKDDRRREFAPWWRAALIVDRVHTTVMCSAVDMLSQQSCTARERGLRSATMPITPLTVKDILGQTWGYGREGWPGAYRDFPEDADLEREGKLPRLLLGAGPQGLAFDLGLKPESDMLSFPCDEAVALGPEGDGVLRFAPEPEFSPEHPVEEAW